MSFYAYFRKLLVLSILSLTPLLASGQDVSPIAAGKMLPGSLGDFRAGKTAAPTEEIPPHVTSSANRSYVSKDGAKFLVHLYLTNSDAAAYAALTRKRTELTASGVT